MPVSQTDHLSALRRGSRRWKMRDDSPQRQGRKALLETCDELGEVAAAQERLRHDETLGR